ncbi:unnamed protein product [Closterium sp. NIES-54]
MEHPVPLCSSLSAHHTHHSPTLSQPLPSTLRAAQNEARNAMLEHGQASGARWILPWDGNQFLTREAWHRIVAAADRYEAQGLTVFKVAMVKVQSVQQPAWLNASSLFRHIRPHAPGQWESQVAFRNDSPHRFKEGGRHAAEFSGSHCISHHHAFPPFTLLSFLCLPPLPGNHPHCTDIHRSPPPLTPSHHPTTIQPNLHAGVAYGDANKLDTLIRVCGSGCFWLWPELLKALHLLQRPPTWAPCREFFADTGECGCQAVIGRDYHERRVSVRTALQCGYSVRLWYHPCPGVDIKKAFRSTAYRTELRVRGREMFQEQIRAAMVRHGVLPVMGKADGGEL